jgi:hypothetical protein
VPLIGPILGLVFGRKAKGQIEASGGAQTGRDLATAGILISWLTIAFYVVLVIVIVIVLASSS